LPRQTLPPKGETDRETGQEKKELRMQRVFVVDQNNRPLTPCHPARARVLLRKGQAAIFRRFPLVIILKHEAAGDVQPVELKIDPGSKATGVAIVVENKKSGNTVVWGCELQHRGETIKDNLLSRRAIRRGRRNRRTRYREARFDNRTRPAGWLPPSLMSRIHNVVTWVRRITSYTPVSLISMELVKFDLQKIENPEISGVEYQQGTLAGYEVREYLLEKWGRKCAYCGIGDIPLQVEHIQPKAKGGTNRVSNLCLSCDDCNKRKGSLDIREFLKGKPELLRRILQQAKAPLRDATAVNATRWALFERLKATSLPVETGSGGRTKFNRASQEYPKAHWIDAACVGVTGMAVRLNPDMPVLGIKACGHGSRQMCRMDRFGFPRTAAKGLRVIKGFRTGDIVKAVVPSGKPAGEHLGRVAIRTRGWFNIATSEGTVRDVHHKYCQILHHADGYNYSILKRKEDAAFLPMPEGRGTHAANM